jgi:hypothetical protein
VSEDEFALLNDLSGQRGAKINSAALSELLGAQDQI